MSENGDKGKKLRFLIILSTCFSLLAITILLVVWTILLTDKNKNNHVRSDVESSEIVRKNYIKGFENISETGEFSYRLREDEINDLLLDGVKSINDKYIESINYERSENNLHIFYVDLKKMPIKTRVVLTTYVSDWSDEKVTLKIYTTKIGKVEATKYLTRKGYLTEKFLNNYFEKCQLPISYNESSQIFEIKATDYISMFPKGNFANLIWDEILKTPNSYSMNPTTLGINVSFSSIRTNSNLNTKTFETEVPNFYSELKDELEAIDFSTMSTGESRTAYSISLDEFDHLLTESLPDTKEEVSSSFLSSKATFELVGSNTSIKNDGNLDVAYLYSLNGYLIDVHQDINFNDYSTSYFNAEFSITNSITFANKTSDEYKEYFSPIFEEIYKNLAEKQPNLFTFNQVSKTLEIDLESMNDSHASASLRNSYKSVVLDSTNKTINFVVQKTL